MFIRTRINNNRRQFLFTIETPAKRSISLSDRALPLRLVTRSKKNRAISLLQTTMGRRNGIPLVKFPRTPGAQLSRRQAWPAINSRGDTWICPLCPSSSDITRQSLRLHLSKDLLESNTSWLLCMFSQLMFGSKYIVQSRSCKFWIIVFRRSLNA